MKEENFFGFNTASLKAYSGYYSDSNLLSESASGGAATAISEQIIQGGGGVFGVTYTENFREAVYSYANELDDLQKFKSSKYITSKKNVFIDNEWISVYEGVYRKLADNKTILFIGLGCDVASLLKYLDKRNVNTDRLYTIDLICHGPTYPEVQADFLNMLENKYNSQIIDFSVRYKKEGWKPPYIFAKFANGKVYEERLYESEFGYAFKTYSRKSCYKCKFKGENHVADLTLGDYWGCTEGMEGYNPMGVSIIFTRTIKGEDIVSKLKRKKNFVVKSADMELALKHNITFYQCRTIDEREYEVFDQTFRNRGLHTAVKNSKGYKCYRNRKVKRIIKQMLPKKIVKIIQNQK